MVLVETMKQVIDGLVGRRRGRGAEVALRASNGAGGWRRRLHLLVEIRIPVEVRVPETDGHLIGGEDVTFLTGRKVGIGVDYRVCV
jgi:hypothetical protein